MPVATSVFDALRELLAGADHVVVSGHEQADGDAVGATAALRRHLELEGRKVTALLSEPLSPRYGFMEFGRHYEVYDPERHDSLVKAADAIVMCDLSSLPRLGRFQGAVEASDATTVCVDHHPCEGGGPASLNVLDETARATGQIVWDYIEHVGGRVDREIAESVFVSLCTDTGWFRYPNTDAKVFQLAAQLAEYRLDLPEIHRAIYQSHSSPMLRLLGHVARSMNEERDGRLVWAFIRRAFMDELGVDRYDADPILDVLRSSGRVELVGLFTERDDGSVSVSLRSRGTPDVNVLAKQYGGGGHVYAAGTVLPDEDAVKDMVSTLRHALRDGA